MTPARPGAGPRWRPWHLAALVLVSALAFGAIRAVSSGGGGLRGDLAGIGIEVSACVVALVIGPAVAVAFVMWAVLKLGP